uniref:Uncharacterized protein n=1 Tax=Trieres chinensis TaxID=1514140 RepID=A0A7S1ZV68_TRICV|mmetsp:Transcript_33584/g.68573  ORF Transcript_33584/g.68573 Transcript_33584/m.68573 type:complete len:108 (+) Transcript_33584:190-513(+)
MTRPLLQHDLRHRPSRRTLVGDETGFVEGLSRSSGRILDVPDCFQTEGACKLPPLPLFAQNYGASHRSCVSRFYRCGSGPPCFHQEYQKHRHQRMWKPQHHLKLNLL